MKHLYFAILLFVSAFTAHASKISIAPPITATIGGNATVCQNATGPQITFTGSGGTTPYTFTYHINSGSPLTVTTTGTNTTVTISANTATAGSFTYTLDSVHDGTPPNTEQPISGQAITINVNPQPNANLGGTGSGSNFGGIPVFRVCSNAASLFNFTNTSTSSNTNYTINWGDSSPNFTGTSWTTLSHTYQIGLWNLTYTIQGSNGCSITKPYIVFVGSNPAVSLGNPGNTDICSANSLTFPITGTTNNPPGTTYTVTFNDSSPPQVFNHPPPSSVTHTFINSSCGTTSSDGSNSYPNSFSANIVATNPCSTSSVGVVPIYVSQNPQADFTGPVKGCTGIQTCFTNTSLGNQVISNVCSTPPIIWTVLPSTGFTVASGSLGNDFSSTDPGLWLSGSDNLCLNFNTPGTYSITVKMGNKCGVDVKTKTICIEPPLIPQFTLSQNSGCVPLSVSTTNTTNLTNQCSPPTYNWAITYTSGNCGTTSAYTFTGGTTAASASPSFNFTEAGTYSIKLTTTNSCGSVTSAGQTVTVKKPPTVAINNIADFCQNVNLNASASVSLCSSSPGTSYLWTFTGGTPPTATSATAPAVTYSTAGTYTVSLAVTNECGTTTATTNPFNVLIAPIVQNETLTICSGTTFSLSPSNSTPGNSIPVGTTYSWPTPIVTGGMTGGVAGANQGSISGTLTNNSSAVQTATYTITPKVGSCPGAPFTLIVSVNPAPTITNQPASSSVCIGGTPQLLSITLNSSAVTPTYQWYSNTTNLNTGGTIIPGATTASYNPPATTVGTLYYYCVISLTSGGCTSITSNTANVTVTPPASFVTQPLASQNLCVGVTIPTALTTTFTGGAGNPSYQWYSNMTNTNTGGTPISGATGASYTPPLYNTAGNYFYYVVLSLNGNGCGPVTSSVAAVNVFNDPVVNTQPLASQILCQGATPTRLEVIATGGSGTIIYQWYSNSSNNTTSGTAITGATSSTYFPNTTAVGTLFYYCIVTQNTAGCSVTSMTAAVTVNAAPTITTQPAPSTICSGGSPTPMSVAYINGVGTPTYQWYSNTTNNTTTGTAISGATNSAFTPTAVLVGTTYYYCIITLPSTGGCSSIASNTAAVTVTPGATINTQPLPTQSLCIGGTLMLPLVVSYSGGTGTASYQWYSNISNSNTGGTLIGGANAPSYTPPVFTSAGTSYYYVVVTLNGNGCGPVTSDVAAVSVVTDPILTAQPLASQTLCQNAAPTALSVTASGGIGVSYNYQWYSAPTNSTTSGTPLAGETNNTFMPPTNNAGTVYYYCEITQGTGLACNATSDIALVNVNLAPAIANQPTSSTVCVNQPATTLSVTYLNGVGAPNYQWFSNTLNTNTGGTAIPGANNASYVAATTTAGIYYYYCEVVFPTLAGGCEMITSNPATVTVNDNPIISNATTTICSATAFTISPASGGGNIVPATTTYTWSAPVINPPGSVSGAVATLTAQTNISQTLVNLTTNPATVTYTVTPIAGVCQGPDFQIVVIVNPAINPNIVATNNACFGVNNASITTNVTGGIPFSTGSPYLYSWTGPGSFSSTASSISNILPGSYSLVIQDAGGCPFSNTYVITEPADIAITNGSESDVTCFGAADGAINITMNGGTGAYAYTWTKNGSYYASTEDLLNLSPGTYILTVTDANNCGPKNATFTITEPTPLVASLVSQTNVLCYGASTGAISVNVSGGTVGSGYNYSWIGPGAFTGNSQNLTNIAAGIYTLTVTDANGCTKNLSVTITQSTEILIGYTTTPITCYGADNASITVNLSGGNAPYTFQWSNLATALSQTNLGAGNYTITVTDSFGCIKLETINIPQAPIFVSNPIVSQITCFGAHNGSINLNLTGGIAPVALSWADGSTAGLIRNNLGAGTYTATISDGTPCYITKTFTIIEPQPIVLGAVLTNAFGCTNPNIGSINLIPSGGTPPFTFSWSNGATTEDLNAITSGNYLVNVTDANGCTKSAQYSITRPDPIAIDVTTDTAFDCALHTVQQNFVAAVSGGVPPYQLQWSSGIVSGANHEIMHSDTNGTVVLMVTDALGCTANYTVTVDNPVLGYTAFEPTSYGYTSYGIYSIGDPIQFNSHNTGDFVSVSWNFGDGTFSTELSPTHTYVNPRDYVVTQTVTYPFGCVYVQTISLIIEQGYMIVVPNAFTPNGDRLNDNFRPVTKRLTNVHLDVYDTWGSVIYSETGDVLVGWDGKVKDKNAENGNYYCKVSGETFYGTTINESHPFVLIK